MTAPANHSPPILFALAPHPLFAPLLEKLGAVPGLLSRRNFPDGETYLRIDTPVAGHCCVILTELLQPDTRYLPLVFLATTLLELGATSVGLVAPYLGYMRQDQRFQEGEAVTSRIFASELSRHCDWLVTVDPHLHRYRSLDEIYRIPTRAVHGAPALAHWLRGLKDIFLVGPDAESRQWVEDVAQRCGHPFVIGSKRRLGDREVTVTLPDLAAYRHLGAVIVDDVISSGHTLLQCIDALRAGKITDISCAAVHGIFAEGSDAALQARGLHRLIATNSISHPLNTLDISGLLAEPVLDFLR